MARSAQFVVKISKLCNLRCSYCYEFAHLADKTRMSLTQAEAMFRNIAAEARRSGFGSVSFVWHGGEPLLVKPEVYRAIGEIQREVFGEDIRCWNTTQSNLTVLTEDWISFLKSGEFFKGLGVSFDVYGDQRVDIRGRLRTEQTMANMQRLIDAGISFGGITVLAQNTREAMTPIVKFYDDIRIPARLLPFYRADNPGQVDQHSLTGDEIVAALTEALDVWLGSQSGADLDPLGDYLDVAMAHLQGAARMRYSKDADEQVFIVDVDGSTWGVTETYDPAYRYGDIFHEDFGAILDSAPRARAVAEAESRVKRHCGACPYAESCPGWFVADATPEQQKALEDSGCVARRMVETILDRLERAGIAEGVRTGAVAFAPRAPELQGAEAGI